MKNKNPKRAKAMKMLTRIERALHISPYSSKAWESRWDAVQKRIVKKMIKKIKT